MDDPRPELLDEESVDRVDVVALACTETEVVQARAQLIERSPAVPVGDGAHQDAGTAADAIQRVVVADQRLHREEVTELLPERQTTRRVPHAELDVGDAVQLDAHGPSPSNSSVSDAGRSRATRGQSPAGRRWASKRSASKRNSRRAFPPRIFARSASSRSPICRSIACAE